MSLWCSLLIPNISAVIAVCQIYIKDWYFLNSEQSCYPDSIQYLMWQFLQLTLFQIIIQCWWFDETYYSIQYKASAESCFHWYCHCNFIPPNLLILLNILTLLRLKTHIFQDTNIYINRWFNTYQKAQWMKIVCVPGIMHILHVNVCLSATKESDKKWKSFPMTSPL